MNADANKRQLVLRGYSGRSLNSPIEASLTSPARRLQATPCCYYLPTQPSEIPGSRAAAKTRSAEISEH